MGVLSSWNPIQMAAAAWVGLALVIVVSAVQGALPTVPRLANGALPPFAEAPYQHVHWDTCRLSLMMCCVEIGRALHTRRSSTTKASLNMETHTL